MKAAGTGNIKQENRMKKGNVINLKSVTILGSLPPLRALSSYCLAFSLAVSKLVKIEFISFKHIYPSFLYPGGVLRNDNTFPGIDKLTDIKIRRNISWFNPLSWIVEGVSTNGQLLHAQWWSPPLILVYTTVCALYKIRNKPVVITVHNIIQHEKRSFYNLYSRIIFKLGDHFIVHSKSNKNLLARLYGINPERVTQIPHGPLKFQHQKDIDCEDAKVMIGLRPENRVVLVFGAIRPYKGVDIALEAFAEVVKEVPEARLIVAGRLWESWERYEKIIVEKDIKDHILKHLHYIDTSEVAKYFVASDLVVLPYTRFDSQSGVGATAVGFKKPLIVTKTGGLPELVINQENAVPPGDAKALSERIVFCLKNSPAMERMSEESAAIAKKISWDRVAEDTIAIYQRLLNEKMSG